MKKLLLLLLFGVLAATLVRMAHAAAAEQNMLVMVPDGADPRILGIMYDARTCDMVARAMNDWAKFPPKTPVGFVCLAPSVNT